MQSVSKQVLLAALLLTCSLASQAAKHASTKDDPGIATLVKSVFDAVASNKIDDYKKLILTVDDVRLLIRKTFDHMKTRHLSAKKKSRYYRIDRELQHVMKQVNDPYYVMSLIKYHRIINGFAEIRRRAERAGLKWQNVQFQRYQVSSNRIRRGVQHARVYIYLTGGGKVYKIYLKRLMKRQDGSWALAESVRWSGEEKPASYLPK